jgi:hypothetical protein
MPVLRGIEGMVVPGYFTMDGDTGLWGVPLGNSSYFWDHLEEERTEAKHVRNRVRDARIDSHNWCEDGHGGRRTAQDNVALDASDINPGPASLP